MVDRLRAHLALRLIGGQYQDAVHAGLKDQCLRNGHALGQKVHDGDRWIAATAVRYGIPLVSHDQIFKGVPDLELLTELEGIG
jgi:predicted nucleic acid-binding protein